MSTVTPASQVALLTKLPVAPNPPQVPSGMVSLFKDNNWGSQRLDINIYDYTSSQRQRIQNSMYDAATWIAFNLPIGTVVTMTDNVTPVPSGKTVADLSGCGRSVDLVGTGRTESVDLPSENENDCISSFFWRTVDLNMGAIELFDDAGFNGNRSTLFLSEWNSATIYSIADWWLQDRLTAIRWKTLTDRQTAVLFDNSDGSGNTYGNIKGWGNLKEISNLDDIGFNDKVSAFRWDGIVPKKEIIAPFNVVASSASGSSGLTSVVNGTNDSSVQQPVTVTLQNSTAQTVTVATTDQSVVGVSSTFTLSATEGVKDVASSTATWAVTVSYQYTHTETKTTSQTQTIGLSIAQTVNAPPMTTYTATLLVSIGQIPPTVYHTTAQRWYDVQVAGSKPDPANNGWYLRTENVDITVNGSLASNTTVNIKATPLPTK